MGEWTKVEIKGAEFKEIIYEKKAFEGLGSASRITINRPEKMNTITKTMQDEMGLCFMDSNLDPAVGVVILTAVGDRVFSAGGDLTWESTTAYERDSISGVLELQRYMRACSKPIIARVNGFAIGGGNHWAYFCDFTIAAEHAIFGQNGPRVGSPADGYLVQYLTRIIGQKRAREMWMLCRRYTAQEALQMGLVNAVVPMEKLDDEVDKWCREILSLSPTCMRILKETFDREIDRLRAGEFLIANEMAPGFFMSGEQHEAQTAFFEKRSPNFAKYRKVAASYEPPAK